LLGVFLFGGHIRTGALDLAIVIAGAAVLSRSGLIADENTRLSCEHKPALSAAANSPSATHPLALPKDPPVTGSVGTRRSRALSPDVTVRANSSPGELICSPE
jgi:hypothetical protein